MSNDKHILIVPSWYPENPGHINGTFFREQAIALHKAGYKVGVLRPEVRSIKDIKAIFNKPYGIVAENDFGVNTYRFHALNITPRMPNLSQKRWVRLGEKLFLEYVNKHGMPDIVHVHSLIPGGFLAEKIKVKYHIPYVVTEHSSSFSRKLVSPKIIKELAPVVDASSANLAVSNAFKELLTDIFKGGGWSYLPNIVSENFITSRLTPKEDSAFNFINVCYLTKNKNLDLLIRAFSKAFKGNYSVKLKIGGDGEEKENLVELVRALSVEEQVVFLGQLTREQVKEEISSADAFVLSSKYETFGVVLIEALALGKPVIATKCGGPESIVTPQVGYLVENNSEEELSKAMLDLIASKNKFNPEKIRAYCLNNFSEKAVVEKLGKVYESVLAKNEK